MNIRCLWLLAILPVAGCRGDSINAVKDAGADPTPVGAAPGAAPVRFDAGRPVFPPTPRLATTAAELAVMKAAPDAVAQREAALRAAQPLIDSPPPLPEGYGSWVFYYACPDDGATLHKITLTEHKCPSCKKTFTDDRTVAAYRCLMHHEIENAGVKLGWAYAWTGDEKYAQGVKRILLKLAQDYDSYPARLDRWGHVGFFAPLGGRRYVQSLDEAVGVIRLAKGYDLTRNSSVWSDAERQDVEQKFFRATADSIARFTQKSNHQTWFNAGMIAVGSTLGDTSLITRVLTMNNGVLDQLDTNVGPDGLWNEGTVSYHNYALQALIETAEITRRLGLRLQDHPKLKMTITGPLRAAYPNGQYPAINDSDPADTGVFTWAFKWGWETYRDPTLAQAVARGNADQLREMLGPEAKVDWPPAINSEALTGVGLAILRHGSGPEARCTFLDYGPHGGGHGHFDKLNLMLYANGREWLLDPGRLTYSHKEYKTWVKNTAAHNTLTRNGQNQAPHIGQLLWLSQNKTWSACAAQSRDAYPDTTLTRYLALGDRLLIDVFEVTSPSKAQFDLLAHAVADRIVPIGEIPAGKAISPGNDDGYQHLTGATNYTVSGDSRWEFIANGQHLVSWLIHEPGEQLITCNGIGYHTTQKTPTLIRRRTTKDTHFITVYDLSGDGTFVRAVKSKTQKTEITITVDTAAGPRNFIFSPTGIADK